jgi:hypothetical protein
MNPVTELREAYREMRAAGLSRKEIALEFTAAVGMFAVAILGFIVLAPYF